MEITIRTYDQFRDDRVKVEVSPGQRAEITIDGAVSTPESDTVPNVTPDYRRIPALELQVTNLETALRIKENRITELAADLKAAWLQAAEWDRDRHTEKKRADENREWAKRAEAKLAETLTDLEESRARREELASDLEAVRTEAADAQAALVVARRTSVASRTWITALRTQLDTANEKLAETMTALEESRALVRQRDAIIHEHAKDLMESREFRAKERQEARQKISQLAGKLSEIRGRVHRPGVDEDLVFDADSEHYDNLVRVIRDIRQALSRTSDLSDTGA
jgi:chromosome segregation ATPase